MSLRFAAVGPDFRSEAAGATLASGTATVVIGPLHLLAYDRKSFTLYNLGAATLSGCLVQINPDPQGYEAGALLANPGQTGSAPNAGLWETIDNTSFSNLAAGSVKTVQFQTTTAKWWRLQALNSLPSITVSGYCNATSV